MSGSRSGKAPHFFESAAAFRAWLHAYGESERELIVGFHNVGSGRPSMKWPESLIARGRMAPPGLAAYARRTERRSRVYSYEQGDEPEYTGAELRRFRKQSAAWEYFHNAPPSYRKTVTRLVTSGKRSATRARRLSEVEGVRFAVCAKPWRS